VTAFVGTTRQDVLRLKDRVQHAVEDGVYYFWVGVGMTVGAITVVRFLLAPPKQTTARP
jgi:hypothetical protein